MTLPKVGTRICCFSICGVFWPDNKHPLRGVVSAVFEAKEQFKFLPDEPDLSSNGDGNARRYDTEYGWFIDSDCDWDYDELVIEEEPS